ncbi:MAG: transcriptional repressor [Dehalococcoidia bacterium]|jgi:Fe2+ or Zn2+ uptake regulation protein|nr:transcriptional repressor [Dehalococcoidia bacterium]
MRKTFQRQVILEELRVTKDHPRAAELYARVRHRIPTVSFGTVYRNLRMLRDQGLIQELTLGDEASRWDGNYSLHYHFTCQNCGQVQDLEVEPDSRWEAKIECLTGLAINHHRAEFYGLCSDCRN